MKILVLNAGSSSQKSCLYDWQAGDSLTIAPVPLWQGFASWDSAGSTASVTLKTHNQSDNQSEPLRLVCPSTDPTIVAGFLLESLYQGDSAVIHSLEELDGIGHRVVHGGTDYQRSVRITPAVKAAIDRWSAFAPLHNPANLAGIEAIEAIFKTLGRDITQFAVFDTAFHSTLSPAAYTYPGPHDWLNQGIRRYGFHGTSHQYCSEQVQTYLQQAGLPLAQRLITCHLGNGCSLTAIRDGRSVDTTMGFTPLDGLMMGTRSGSLDPGILLYLLRQHNLTVEQLDRLLNRESGLLGLSGVSNDLRSLLAAIDQGNSRAQLALDVFLHRLRSSIGAFVASLGGVDTIVFTAGIGENSPLIRSQACQGFNFLGLELDEVANAQGRGDRLISTPLSPVRVWVIHTEEEWTIARESIEILKTEGKDSSPEFTEAT